MTKYEEQTQAVIEELRRRPGLTVAEVGDLLNLSDSRAWKLLGDLSRQGVIERQGRGWRVS